MPHDIVSVVKKTVFIRLNEKVVKLGSKIPSTALLTHKIWYDANKQNLKKGLKLLIKKILILLG